ncbi:unnamed protein product [Amoebophrya sp. A25]|nr:unnamed protein product [Amoebophrya sp. A25]|eukprot:GSA25T00000208001.1
MLGKVQDTTNHADAVASSNNRDPAAVTKNDMKITLAEVQQPQDYDATPSYLEVVDIAFNFADEKYDGVYFGKQRHPPDHAKVIARMFDAVRYFPAPPGRDKQEMKTKTSGLTTSSFPPGTASTSSASSATPIYAAGSIAAKVLGGKTGKKDGLNGGKIADRNGIKGGNEAVAPSASSTPPALDQLPCVLRRALVQGGGLEWIKKTFWLAERFDPTCNSLFTCVGVHPTMVKEFLFLPERFDPQTGKIAIQPELLQYVRHRGTSSSGGRPISGAAQEEGKGDKDGKVEVSGYGFSDSRIHKRFEDPAYATKHLDALRAFFLDPATRRRVRAVGEIGLDYERTKFCPLEIQRRFLALQLPLAFEFDLPLYIHVRGAGCAKEFMDTLRRNLLQNKACYNYADEAFRDAPVGERSCPWHLNMTEEELDMTLVGRACTSAESSVSSAFSPSTRQVIKKDEDGDEDGRLQGAPLQLPAAPSSTSSSSTTTRPSGRGSLPRVFRSGVVHSFTGTVEDLEMILAHNLFVSVNGCSLRTEEQCEMIRRIPLSRLILETDAPYCGIDSRSPVWHALEKRNIEKPLHGRLEEFFAHGGALSYTDDVIAGRIWGRQSFLTNAGARNTKPAAPLPPVQKIIIMEDDDILQQADLRTWVPPSDPQDEVAMQGAGPAPEMKGKKKGLRKGGGKGKKGKGKSAEASIKKRNEAPNVMQVAEAVAYLKGVPTAVILQYARRNVRRLFSI